MQFNQSSSNKAYFPKELINITVKVACSIAMLRSFVIVRIVIATN